MTDNMKQINFTVEEGAYDRFDSKTEHGEKTEILRQRVYEVAHGQDVAEKERVKDQLREKRNDRRELDREIQDMKNERDELDREIERLEERLDTLLEQDGEIDGALEVIESELHDGVRIYDGHTQVKEAARIGDMEPNDVIDRLKERNPSVPDEAFRLAKPHEDPRWKAEG